MVRLMRMSLGLNEKSAEAFLSPAKVDLVDDTENDYENIEVEEVYI